MAQLKRLAQALAARASIQYARRDDRGDRRLLDVYEAVNREQPIKGLRWSYSHLDQVRAASSSA
jgi:predicted amidohydrolase YtcJ